MILYHGTSAKNAKLIEKEGFVPDKKYNWKVKSKKGFVYLSLAYAPFYAMNTGHKRLAIVKVEVKEKNLFPEDDFLMMVLKKQSSPDYRQDELDKVNLRHYKYLWKDSLAFMGNVAVRPRDINIIGIRYFDGKNLLLRCDPVVSPINFKIMGDYYKRLTEWIYEGKDILKFENFMGGFN